MEEFNRPNHPDFMTTSELKKAGFSGMRDNRLIQQYEIWITGDMTRAVTYLAVADDPLAVTRAYSEVFGIL